MTTACAEDGCDHPAAVRVFDPRGEDRKVCAAHARTISQRDGVVATPLEDADADAEWP